MTLNYIFLSPILYSMNIRQFLALLIFFPLLTFGQFENKKSYIISKCQIAPKIDGVLNDNTWRNLDIANEFSQSLPNNGIPERNPQRTEVKICYDSKNIYFGIMMYDNAPGRIIKSWI